MSKLPDFIICGFQKCGSSALFWNLNQHPEILIAKSEHKLCKDSHGKEINFFSSKKNHKSTHYMGIDWYKSHFYEHDKVCGEVSPNYSDYLEMVLTQMQKYIVVGETKFIFSVRNPIYRAFSGYSHFLDALPKSQNWGEWNPDKDIIYNHKNYYSFKCSYINVLNRYSNIFGKENICVVVQEKLINDTECKNEYNKLFDFLGVSHLDVKNEKHNNRKYKKLISDEEVQYLKDYYTDDVNKLFDFLGYEIKEWKEFC